MKKTVAAAVSVVLALGALTACNNSADTDCDSKGASASVELAAYAKPGPSKKRSSTHRRTTRHTTTHHHHYDHDDDDC